MRLRQTLPWNWGQKEVPVRREDSPAEASYAMPARSIFDALDDFRFRIPSFPAMPDFGFSEEGFLPALDARETDEEVRITIELPGMEEKDVEVGFKDDVLTIRGEKQDVTKHDEGDTQWVERRFGSFRREIPLPADVDADGIKAHFKAGVLTVTAPRTGEPAESHRSIQIQSS